MGFFTNCYLESCDTLVPIIYHTVVVQNTLRMVNDLLIQYYKKRESVFEGISGAIILITTIIAPLVPSNNYMKNAKIIVSH